MQFTAQATVQAAPIGIEKGLQGGHPFVVAAAVVERRCECPWVGLKKSDELSPEDANAYEQCRLQCCFRTSWPFTNWAED